MVSLGGRNESTKPPSLDGLPQLHDKPAHEIMVLFVLRKLILQTRMCSHPVGLDV